jgi:amino acid adenylation domain-containing protein
LAEIWAEVLKVDRVGRNDNFFELGGHSLVVIQMLSRVRQAIGVEVSLKVVFDQPTLAEFAAGIDEVAKGISELPPLVPITREGPVDLSFAQQRLWFLTQFEGASEAYHIPLGLRLKGELNREALTRALGRIVERHESLRTTFARVDGRPVQVIGEPEKGLQLREHDLSGRSSAEEELAALAKREATESFDLESGPLVRGRLIRMGETDHALLLTMHHIVSDGWSVGVLAEEMSALYGAYVRGEEDNLPPHPIQYADYAEWQRESLSGEVWTRQAEYWKRALLGAPGLLELPADRPRPAEQDYTGGTVGIELGEGLTRELKALSQRHGTTLYMTLMAGWGALLSRLSRQEEVVVGTPVANRTRKEIEGLIGFFVNTLALRIDAGGSPTVVELLERVKARVLEAQENQDIPFEQVVEITQPARSLSHSPVFQSMFTWQNTPEGALALPGLEVTPMPAVQLASTFDVTLSLQEERDGIAGWAEYATALFDRSTIERYLGYWKRLLEGMVANEQALVDRLPLLNEIERRQVVEEWNATETEYPREKCIHELFEEHAAKNPDAIAVVSGNQRISYSELNERANRLANHLRALGVASDSRVGVCFERSIKMMVALLATLKAGGAYVPLDPSYPAERMAFMLEDSAPDVVLTHDAAMPALEAHSDRFRVLNLDSNAGQWANHSSKNPKRAGAGLQPENLAYLIYTSGSTGQPKGVMVTHRGLVNSTVARMRYYNAPVTNFMLVSPFTFDSSVAGIFGTLCQGGTLILAPHNFQQDFDLFTDSLAMNQVSHLLCIPSLWEALLEQSSRFDLSSLRAVIVAGESCSRGLVNDHSLLLPDVALYNEYGPTEVTVWSTVEECTVASPDDPILIGRAIQNTQARVLDDYLEPVPPGTTGEIYLGGEGVARGYLNRADLTAEKFVPDSFSSTPGARFYRAGDLGRWTADGRIEFLGRTDHQIKIRGFRVELGEIETALAAYAGVSKAVVVARDDENGGKRLVAYYTGEKAEAESLRSHLSSALPPHMLPSAFVHLESLPLLSNGKLDRNALPAPDGESYVTRGYQPPIGETEIRLARIWSDLLKVDRVGRLDNFFELGGHSLLASMLIVRIKQDIGVDIGLADVFNLPELASLAETIVTAQLAEFDQDELAEMVALLNAG